MLLTLTLLVAAAAPSDDLLDAADTFQRALELVERQHRSCQDALAANLRQSVRDVRRAASKRGTTADAVQSLRLFAAGMVLASGLSTCPSQVTALVSEGVEDLNRAHDGFARWEQVDEERPRRRQRAVVEDEDDDAPPPARARRARSAELGRVRVTLDSPSTIDGTPAVLLELTRADFDDAGRVHFGAMCRAARGRGRTEWSTTKDISVSPGVLKDPAAFSIRYSTLARADTARGQFICHVAVFDERSGDELAATDVDVELPDEPVHPAPRARTSRGCGAGADDPGCEMARNGRSPMDAQEFGGLLASLRNTPSDLSKVSLATSAAQGALITAAQFGLVLETFSSDLSRMDAARALVKCVVNPRHAMGHSLKFSSSLSREEYVRLLSRE